MAEQGRLTKTDSLKENEQRDPENLNESINAPPASNSKDKRRRKSAKEKAANAKAGLVSASDTVKNLEADILLGYIKII